MIALLCREVEACNTIEFSLVTYLTLASAAFDRRIQLELAGWLFFGKREAVDGITGGSARFAASSCGDGNKLTAIYFEGSGCGVGTGGQLIFP